ncbi:MAG TPA: hypothetical protein VFQ18_04165, partial [Candidatus Acidoferrum sp.]|nr:hypothetical protein [Candidatus Acidoferrum sp.]
MQRSIKYWLIVPPVSVAAVQERLICVGPAGVPARFEGEVREGATVAAVEVFEYELKLFAASV